MDAGALTSDIEWKISDRPEAYGPAVAFMEERARAIRAGEAGDCVWLLEHPPLYTAGTSAQEGDLLSDNGFPVYRSGRGGQYTYHGPGQRIGYVMLDLEARKPDLRAYVHNLEDWIIRTLARFSIKGERRCGRVGIWVDRSADKGPGHEDKIAAIGVRVRRWVTYHGVALNLEPELSHFGGIVPCGISDPKFGVTSLVDLGIPVSRPELDSAMIAAFGEVFVEDRR